MSFATSQQQNERARIAAAQAATLVSRTNGVFVGDREQQRQRQQQQRQRQQQRIRFGSPVPPLIATTTTTTTNTTDTTNSLVPRSTSASSSLSSMFLGQQPPLLGSNNTDTKEPVLGTNADGPAVVVPGTDRSYLVSNDVFQKITQQMDTEPEAASVDELLWYLCSRNLAGPPTRRCDEDAPIRCGVQARTRCRPGSACYQPAQVPFLPCVRTGHSPQRSHGCAAGQRLPGAARRRGHTQDEG